MAETKFTPGPWSAEYTPHHEIGQRDLPRYRIVSGKRPIIDGYVILTEDARLIAAAPLMYEAILATEQADDAVAAAEELTSRADAEGWINDPTGSMHVNDAWGRAGIAQQKAKELRRAALSAATGSGE